ncbi:MAG: SusC/RagA family TonB-linked outer membrane protein [Flavobacteriales bacterium]|nr:SusC/RagA family TonB-linked outer membrane protein [Flavobacteriales bacterium]
MKLRLLLLAMVMVGTQHLFAQARNVSGTVKDKSTGEGLPGVAVLIENSSKGVFTDAAGMYTLEIPGNEAVLVFNVLGYAAKQVIVGSQATIDVSLDQNVELDEVVVTAIGIPRDKRAIGFSAQEVSGKNITGARETNLVNALSSKVAGLNVNSSSGAAGASAYLLIRGQNSITGNNQPLFVIDGVPLDNSQLSSSNPLNGRNGFLDSVGNTNRMIDIPQEDIESITVLKGAAATALYGSLAGNGAIIITTKKGRQGAGGKGLNINVSTGWEWSEYNKMVPLQDRYLQGSEGTYLDPSTNYSGSWGPDADTMFWDGDSGYKYDNNGMLVGQSEPTAATPFKPYNNVDDFFRTGFKHNYNFDMSGASDRADYFFSAGYEDQDGIVPNNTFAKYNFGFNGGVQLSEKLSARSSIKYVRSGGTKIEQGSNISGVMLGLLRTPISFDNSNGHGEDGADDPSAYMYDDGSQRKYRDISGYDNPFWTVNQNPLVDRVNRYIGSMELKYKACDWLTILGRGGLDNYTDYRNQHFAIGSRQFSAGQIAENTYQNSILNLDLMAMVSRRLTEDLNLNLTLGENWYERKLTQVYVQGDGFTIPNFYDVSNASSFYAYNLDEIIRTRGHYAMAELAYQTWLYLTLTGRIDKSSTFDSDNWAYFYPSASLGFVFTDAFDLESKSFNYGKLRLAYGTVATGSPEPYQVTTTYSSAFIQDGWTDGITFPFGGGSGFDIEDVKGDPQLGPELSTEIEIGLELKFLQNRAGIDFTWYNTDTKDIILGVPISPSSGFDQLFTNAASMTNKGIEIQAYGRPVETQSGFSWDISVNWARNTNEIVELAPGVESIFIGGFEGSSIRAVAGEPYGSIFGFGFYRDANDNLVIGEDGYPVLDPNERSFGSAQPDWTMGIRNSFSYHGITLSALLDIRKGGVMWNGTKSALYFFGTHQDTEDRTGTTTFEGSMATYDGDGNIVLDANGVPVTGGSNNMVVPLDENWLAFGNANGFIGSNTEDFIEETDWVRLREVSISYRLPVDMVDKTPFTSIEVSAFGRNLWLDTDYTGIDPETSLAGSRNEQGMDYFNMPNTKSYGLGLRFSF